MLVRSMRKILRGHTVNKDSIMVPVSRDARGTFCTLMHKGSYLCVSSMT